MSAQGVGSPDITIVGAGYVGRLLGLALSGARGVGLTLRLVDAAPASVRPGDTRAYAIAAGTVRMLEELGVWQRLDGKTQACSDMRITDSRVAELVRPAFLTIAGHTCAEDERVGEPFAHFVERRARAERVHIKDDARAGGAVAEKRCGGRAVGGGDREAAF